MAEALSDAGVSAQAGEALTEQAEAQRPVDVKPTEPAAEKLTPDQVRAQSVKSAIDKTLNPKPETKDESGAGEKKTDDKKPETEKVEAEKTDVKSDRGPDGKFKATQDESKPADDPVRPRQTAYRDAPQRFDDAAKAEWEGVGENTRGAIHRMQRELEAGIQKYKASADEFESVREYAEMAKSGGTDLKTALSRYVAMENELRRDPIAGLQAVVANLGLKGANGQPATLRDVAAFVLNQKPDQIASKQEATISTLRTEIEGLKRQLSGVSEFVTASRQEAHANSIEAEWEGFKSSNPNAVTLENEMAGFLTKYPASGNISVRERLSDALAWAEAQFPSKIAAQTRVDDVAAQTRDKPERPINPAGQKSISGPPSGNQSSIARKLSRKEAISKAIRAAGL